MIYRTNCVRSLPKTRIVSDLMTLLQIAEVVVMPMTQHGWGKFIVQHSRYGMYHLVHFEIAF